MSLDLIKFAFVAGELSKKLHGRPDLEKFDLGLSICQNWFVDYHGGISTRPGLEFLDYIMRDDLEVRLWPFKFNSDLANTYQIMFGDSYIRFVQDGGYVLEDDIGGGLIQSTSPARFDLPGNSFDDGDWLKIDGRTYIAFNNDASGFDMHDPFGNAINNLDGHLAFATVVQRIYTIDSPYASTDIPDLHISQRLDLLRLTHKDFTPMDLTRTDHTNWSLAETVFGNQVTAPANRVGAPITVGTYGFVWGVTAVNRDGVESSINGLYREDGTENFTSTAGGYIYLWSQVSGAKYYNVYRSNIVAQDDANRGQEVGFIGRVYSPKHSEINTVPDFTRTPPFNTRPFDQGTIEAVDIVAGGAGYDDNTVVTAVGGGGTGFLGYPIINASGSVTGVVVLNGGRGFTSAPVMTFTVGAGATATPIIGPLTGTYPILSCRFQQRELYAATENQPLTIWGSRPGQLNNFDVSSVVADDDSFEHTIDSDESTPIRHIISMRAGLLILTDSGIWQLSGGGLNDAVTPSNALADPHSYTGVSKVPPLRIDSDLIYQEAKGAAVRMLSYSELSKIYAGVDVSILSSHFFSSENKIVAWSYADSPYKIVWASQENGRALGFTIVKEQNAYAWTQHWTKGYFVWNNSIQEDSFDRTYFIVKRRINGRTSKFLERLGTRTFEHVEDAFHVDSGLSLGSAAWPAGALTAAVGSGELDSVTCSTLIFNDPRDLGKILRMSGGKAEVVNVSGDNVLTVNWLRPVSKFIPETTTPAVAEAGEWTLDSPVSSVSGLWHLEGETVSILADGNVLPQAVVVDGAVSFPLLVLATRVSVGLPYRCIARLLPLNIPNATVESRRKRVMATAMRLDEARGVKAGLSLTNLYDVKERTNETPGEPNELISEIKTLPIRPKFDKNAQIYFVVDDPLPATILGIVLSAEVGDDPE